MELMIECLACGRNTPYDVMELEGYIYIRVYTIIGKSVGNKWNFMGNIPSFHFFSSLWFNISLQYSYFCKYVLYK